MGRVANGVRDASSRILGVLQVAQDVFHHHHAAVHHHTEIQRPQRKQIRGNVPQVQQDRGEQQGKRDRQSDNEGAAYVSQKEAKNKDDQNDAFGQVVQYGVGGVAQQVARGPDEERF